MLHLMTEPISVTENSTLYDAENIRIPYHK